MKRFIALILLILLAAGLAACGEDYSKHQFDELGEDFHWDMTVEEAYAYIDARQIGVKTKIEVDEFDTFTAVNDRYYTFNFDADGNLEFVKINLYGNENKFRLLKEKYGEYDKYEEDYDGYLWYGTIDGQNTVMAYTKFAGLWLEFKRP